MVYAMSDIHGEYDKYKAMLEQIHFSWDDDLYVLGDVIDRGPKPVEVLRDMSMRGNVFPILGNHEAVAIHMLEKLLTEMVEENCNMDVFEELDRKLRDWRQDGGGTTIAGFQSLSKEEKFVLLDYLREFAPYEIVDAGNRRFVLVHAGLQNFSENRPLHSYGVDELIFDRQDLSRRYYSDPNTFVVVGHIPTLAITGEAKIHEENNNICIDCGSSMPGGRLACLCLDTMQAFYV